MIRMGREGRVERRIPRTAESRERDRLRFLASKVKDEQHWSMILDSCPTDEDRASLEREVAPHLPFRRCGNKDCVTGEPPLWVPVLLVRATATGPTSRAQVLMKLCTPCKAKVGVADLLTWELWTRIVFGHEEAGSPIPERGLTTLTFDAIQ